MPWVETCAMDQRRLFVAEYLSGGGNLSGLCRQYGISRPTGYKWLRRYREAGSLVALAERSRRPRRSPHRTAPELEARVVALRQRYGWGGRKLRLLLGQEGISLPKITIDRIIKRHGLIAAEQSHPQATRRFARAEPNQAWQVDFKGHYPLTGGRACYPLTMLDDCTRHCVRLEPLVSPRTEPVWRVFVDAFRSAGLPDQMLFDRGIPWYSSNNGHGLTRLGVRLINQGVTLIFGRPFHPQTRGKVERFHGSLAQWLRHAGIPSTLTGFRRSLAVFRQDYNQVRPHEALDMQTPASRWRPSARPYRAQPPAWEYPAGAQLKTVTSWGTIGYRRKTYFVSEALPGETVRCQEFDGKLLVSYRHMAIREIDLRTGRNSPLLQPAAHRVSTMS